MTSVVWFCQGPRGRRSSGSAIYIRNRDRGGRRYNPASRVLNDSRVKRDTVSLLACDRDNEDEAEYADRFDLVFTLIGILRRNPQRMDGRFQVERSPAERICLCVVVHRQFEQFLPGVDSPLDPLQQAPRSASTPPRASSHH